MSSPRVVGSFVLLVLAASGCGQDIGDACETALDCSSQGSRLCDRTQPNGYCTIRGCEQGTCPDDSVCVKFRPAQERLALTYCMYECEDDDDCRNDEGYRCTSAKSFSSEPGDVEILGSASQRFCAAKPRTPIDAGTQLMSMEPEPSERADSGAPPDASSASDAASNAIDAASSAIDAASSANDGG